MRIKVQIHINDKNKTCGYSMMIKNRYTIVIKKIQIHNNDKNKKKYKYTTITKKM